MMYLYSKMSSALYILSTMNLSKIIASASVSSKARVPVSIGPLAQSSTTHSSQEMPFQYERMW